eukprot:COSAG01_NODE_145_length_24103_cov_41.178012_8_plen_81_part_00
MAAVKLPIIQARSRVFNLRVVVQVMKCTCYLGDISMYSDFNEVYLQYFADPATRPARVCFAVQDLPFGALVECELTAYTM